jgi:Fe-S-cluster containining protein
MAETMSAALLTMARQRQAELDEAIAAWRLGPGSGVHLWCKPGCGNCCSLTVNTTYPEALAIADTLAEANRQQLVDTAERMIAHARQSDDARSFLRGYRRAVGSCPFLDETDNCSIYPDRPLACRALLATRPADWCGVNLAELAEIERDSFLASLDREVVAWPTHYAAAPQELAAELERGLIFTMLRTHGFGVTGNLPLLVHLAGQPGCSAALLGGAPLFREFLAEHHCTHPFLVQIHEP